MSKQDLANIQRCCEKIDAIASGAAGIPMMRIESDIEFERLQIHQSIRSLSHGKSWVMVILFSIFYSFVAYGLFADSYLILQMGRGNSIDFSWVLSIAGFGFWIAGSLLIDKLVRENVVKRLNARYEKWLFD